MIYFSDATSMNDKKISLERDILLTISYFHTKNYIWAIKEANSIKKRYSSDRYELLDVISGVSFANPGDFYSAKRIFKDLYSVTTDKTKQDFFAEIINLLDAANSYSYKNPILAGVLSTVIPGLGYVYCGRFVDAIISFLLVGLSGYISYDGYRNNSWVQFGVFSLFTISFYGGNIYGSVRRAIKDNYLIAKDELDKINVRLYEYEIFYSYPF